MPALTVTYDGGVVRVASSGGAVAVGGHAGTVTMSPSGVRGPSNYDLWKAEGNEGSVQDYLDSLQIDVSPEIAAALAAADSPTEANPFSTESATESAVTEQRVDYAALAAAALSI